MTITNLHPAVGGGQTRTIILGKVESDLVEARRVEGPDREVLAMFPRPEDVISQDNDRCIITKKVVACMKENMRLTTRPYKGLF